ncbi:MAG: hypothetical protein WCO23_00660 [bacterium]
MAEEQEDVKPTPSAEPDFSDGSDWHQFSENSDTTTRGVEADNAKK